MPLKVAIQMDPVERVNIETDTTFFLMLEAQTRGHGLWRFSPEKLSLEDGRVREIEIAPEEIGLKRAAMAELKGGDAAHNAAAIRRVLAGEKSAFRDIVVLNSAAALMVAGKASDIKQGAALAVQSIDSGKAAEALKKPGTVGHVVEGATMRIVDEQGRDVKQGEVGEIYLRGPLYNEFTYNNDDAKRREIALGDLVTVGDVGYQDADGYVFLCDRKRDMIISGGVNIYPAEIESVLIQMPGVRDCAVFGIPDEEFGEQICAHVEPLSGATLDSTAVRAYLGQHLARYKVPKVVELSASLPREDSGKIFKRKLRSPYWEKTGRSI